MKRRTFLTSSLAASSLAALPAESSAGSVESGAGAADAAVPAAPGGRELFELRLYHLRRGPMQKAFDDFYRKAAIPAMKRHGIGPVGVFNVMFGPDQPAMHVLLSYQSADGFTTAMDRVRADAEYQAEGAEFINAPPSNPAYVRVESCLMRAFVGMPRVEVPAQTADKKPRVFELRTYEAHSKKANNKKVEMFNQGEISIFRKCGLQPVFFGETIIGRRLPCLTYMLVFDTMAARDKNWGAFVSDPEWRKLSTTPGYTDPEILTNISSVILRPTDYSQI